MNILTSAPRRALAAIFLASMAVLILQIALTRVASATITHQGAFLVIGLVMLGLSAAGSVLYVRRNRASGPPGLSEAALALAATGVGSVLCGYGFAGASALQIPGVSVGLVGTWIICFFGLFFGGGYAISFLLAEYAQDASRLYWFDLMGAAVGCVVVIPMLDGGSPLVTVIACGLMFAGAGLLISEGASRSWGLVATGICLVATVLGVAFPGLTRLHMAKGAPQDDVIWESWNRLSRVSIHPDVPDYEVSLKLLTERLGEAEARKTVDRWRIGWGISPAFQGAVPEMRWVVLDSEAGTQIVKDGATKTGEHLEYLDWDVTTVGHQVKAPLGDVFVIGGGGGRDVLTALHFGASHVDVGELNPDVVRASDEVLAEFSGGPIGTPE